MASNKPASRPLSRRTILKGAAAVSAAAAFPTIIPSSALGDDKKTAPSNRLNLGFIGIGKQASGHLNFMLGRTDTQVIATCDVDSTRREHFRKSVDTKYEELKRKDYKGCVGIVDYHELLARKDIDGVMIATEPAGRGGAAASSCSIAVTSTALLRRDPSSS